jgi:hypothetical protein
MYSPPAPPAKTARSSPLTTIRIVLAVSAAILTWLARSTRIELLYYAAAACLLAIIFARVFAVTGEDRAIAARFANATMTPERVALRRQIDLLRRMQIALLAVGLPLVVVDIALGWPQAVGMACFAVPTAGMIAGAHRRTLLGRFYALAEGMPYQPRGAGLVPGLAPGVTLRVPLSDGVWAAATVVQLEGNLIRVQTADGAQHWIDVRSLAGAG